ncbi:MAG: uroporphyrinogen decarboxylase [Ignavibacteriales bacterium]|nr:uroporphyrinogen decarboxylase [Ignavibacteriales bacterium]
MISTTQRKPVSTNSTRPSNDLFLRACRREDVERTPVWFMRQAGRYLPEYRRVREKADFLTLCKTPDLAAEVTIQPVDILGVDAAIIFSDILVVPEAMGMELIVEEGRGGPRFPIPLRSRDEINKLGVPDPHAKLPFVMEAIKTARRSLNNRVPLIGFAGSPWTLAAYMVEGKGSKEFRLAKELLFSAPKDAYTLLDKLARAVAAYLNAQIEAGAQALQIFDTWGGLLGQEEFEEFSLRYIKQVLSLLKTDGAPVILFCKDCGHSLEKIADAGAGVVSLDWKTDIRKARDMIGSYVALQGNLDPVMLFAPPERIERGVRSILDKFGKGNGHVFNLGHGILPETPVEHAQVFVNAVKSFSPQYHG